MQINPDQWSRFMQEFINESDRAAAILGAASLDNKLEKLLRAYFIDESDIIQGLLYPDGPLGSFAVRIKLAYVLGLITKTEYLDLKYIKEIRNQFAHKLEGITFSTNNVADFCSNLSFPINFEPTSDQLSSIKDPRTRYVMVVTTLGFILDTRQSSSYFKKCIPLDEEKVFIKGQINK